MSKMRNREEGLVSIFLPGNLDLKHFQAKHDPVAGDIPFPGRLVDIQTMAAASPPSPSRARQASIDVSRCVQKAGF